MLEQRVLKLNKNLARPGTIVYICSRDQRIDDNAALAWAIKLAQKSNSKIYVGFRLFKDLGVRAAQHFDFMVSSLIELSQKFEKHNISFRVFFEDQDEFIKLLNDEKPGAIVFDFSPLTGARRFQKSVAQKIECPVYVVDTHNIVPVWITSTKQEFAARTIRPKIHKHLESFLDEYYKPIKMPTNNKLNFGDLDWKEVKSHIVASPADNLNILFEPGETAAHKQLSRFIKNKLTHYSELRNDPANDHLSDLSPYLHFGLISSAQVVRAISSSDSPDIDKDSFIEELVIRKELSDNFCFFNPFYDKPEGANEWARLTLDEHLKDPREYIYSKKEFELAQTHDPAWNAAQIQMTTTGKMHGYMRMYWAKKILEWTNSAAEALEIAIYLNDKYSLDGYDPNGYTGIMWSIFGVHDRGWTERPIFGKIRYMNFAGLKRKFKIEKYIEKWQNQPEEE